MEFITPLAPAYAEIFLLGMICAVLVFDLFISDAQRGWTLALTLFALVGCFALTLYTNPIDRYTFSNMFVEDALAVVLKLVLYVATAVMLIYSQGYLRARGIFKGEYFALTLFATFGMMVMISANHLLTLYIGLELMSLALYAMVALQRDSAIATEAAMKYFVLGALASGMLLYGMSMLYGATGTLEITRMSELISSGVSENIILVFALVFIVAGVGFKLGVVPFHMWVPDVYQGAPTAVALFLSSATKLAAFAFIVRLLVFALGADYLIDQWAWMFVVMAVLSFAVGNITAIAQTNLKRMLAYSTISHMGFVLLGILSGSEDGLAASMFYVVVYVILSLGAFGVILLLSRQGFEADRLDDLKGLAQRSPWYAAVMLMLMFALAGIPPTVGFYAKLSVLWAVIDAGYVWLAVVAVIFSLIGAFYYLRVVKLMYFDAPTDAAPVIPQHGMGWLLSINGLLAVILGILPGPLMALCHRAITLSLQ